MGIVKKKDYDKLVSKITNIAQQIERIKKFRIKPSKKLNNRLMKFNVPPVNNAVSLADLLKRPHVSFDMLKKLNGYKSKITDDEAKQVEIELKYKGFIDRQMREIENFKRVEKIRIPDGFRFNGISGLSKEIIEKLSSARPLNLGQASRMSGITPVAISILMVYLKRYR